MIAALFAVCHTTRGDIHAYDKHGAVSGEEQGLTWSPAQAPCEWELDHIHLCTHYGDYDYPNNRTRTIIATTVCIQAAAESLYHYSESAELGREEPNGGAGAG